MCNSKVIAVSMRATVALCLTMMVPGIGCNRQDTSRGEITGEVTLDGQPLEQGSLLFTPTDGARGVVTGGPINNGKYALSAKDGPSIGWNRVEIRAVRKTGKMAQKPMAPAGEMVEEYAEAIAARFNSASTLNVEVKSGENTANFDVKSE